MEKIFNRNTLMGEIRNYPEFQMLKKHMNIEGKDEETLTEMGAHVSPAWNADSMAYGLDALAYYQKTKGNILYHFYTEEEQKADKTKEDTAIFWFPVDKKAPFAVVIAGGGYMGVCSIVEAFPVARRLNEMGIHAFILDYRAGTDCAAKKSEEDLQRAIQYIFENKKEFQIEESYIVIGFSAGGHLTAELGTDNRGYQTAGLPKPDVLCLSYALLNFSSKEGLDETEICGAMFGRGKNPEYYAEMKPEFAPIHHVSETYPPTFIWQTTDDELIPYEENAPKMKAKLEENGVPVRLKTVPHGPHGLGLGTGSEAEGWLEEAVKFWKEQKEE